LMSSSDEIEGGVGWLLEAQVVDQRPACGIAVEVDQIGPAFLSGGRPPLDELLRCQGMH
jgi:hypothetical protein